MKLSELHEIERRYAEVKKQGLFGAPKDAVLLLDHDIPRLLDMARNSLRPDPLGEALNSGDGVYRP